MNTTTASNDPPGQSIGSLLSLPEQLESLMFGQNVDMTPQEFLLHTGTSYAERVDHHIQQYRAMIYTIGMIAGVAGTEEERTAVRSAIAESIEKYGASLKDRNQREHWYDRQNTPIDLLTTAAGGIESVWGLTQVGAGVIMDAAGEKMGSDMLSSAGEGLTEWGVEDVNEGVDTIYTNYDGMIATAISDLWNSMVQGAKDWWAWFTDTVATEGLIIALAQAKVDADFLIAEIAIDVGISLVTAGWGGAALRAIRIVGRRVLSNGTDVVIKIVREGADAIEVKRLHHADADIPADIQDKVPDLEDMQGHPVVETDTTPNAATPSTTLVKGTRGQNQAEFDINPETGRPNSAQATLREDFGSSDRGDNATAIGQIGGEGYDGGHLIAHRFMGDTVDGGIAPQVANLNRGAWSKMENEWADWLRRYRPREGNRVEIDVKIDVDPPGAEVPDGFDVEYKVFEVDPDGNRIEIHNDSPYFDNEVGEEFDRVYFRNDGSLR